MSEKTNYDGSTPLKGRREKFAQLVADGDKTLTEAYKKAGYKAETGPSAWTSASEIFSYPEVKARIEHIRGVLAEKLQITREKQAYKLEAIAQLALERGELSNFIRAEESVSKHYALMVDRSIIEQSEEQRQLSRERAQEARRLAEMRLNEDRAPDNHNAEPVRQVPAGAGQAQADTE